LLSVAVNCMPKYAYRTSSLHAACQSAISSLFTDRSSSVLLEEEEEEEEEGEEEEEEEKEEEGAERE
jgi:hypothetical protein